MKYKSVRALVYDTDSAARVRLKAASSEVYSLKEIILAGNRDKALDLLSAGAESFDAIFLASRMGQDALGDFVVQAKASPGGQDSAYILTLDAKEQDSSNIAKNLMEGADAFLLEPFSVDNLSQIFELAMSIRLKRKDSRETAMMRILVQEAVLHLDTVARALLRDEGPGPALPQLKKISATVSELDKELKDKYFIVLRDILKNLELPDDFDTLERKGLSGAGNKSAPKKLSAEERLKLKMQAMGISDASTREEEETPPPSETPAKNEHGYYLYKPEMKTIKIDGDLTSAKALDTLSSAVKESLSSGATAVHIDFKEVEVVNCYGIGKLIDCDEQASEAGAKFSLDSVHGFVLEALQQLHLNEVLSISESSEE